MIFIPLLLSTALAQVESSDSFIKEIESRFSSTTRSSEEVGESIPRYQYMGIINREDIIKSKVVQKALKRLGSIQRLKDQKLFGILETMTVRVFEKTDEYDFFYILSNNNKVSYRVHSKYAEDLKAISEMYEPPRQYSEVKVQKNLSPFDRDPKWLYEAAAGLSLGSARWLADLADDAQVQNGTGILLKGQSLLDMGEQFRLGASVNFESARFSSSRNTLAMQNLSVGVVGKTRAFESNDFQWRLSAEFRYSLFGTITQSNGASQERINFRSTSLNVGWEKLESNSWGPWSWGINFQRDFPKLIDQKQFFSQNTNETNDAFILQLTQGFSL